MSGNALGGKYEILDVIGRGSAGTIYAAKDLQTGQQVAIKSLHAALTGLVDDVELRRFEQEARIAGSVESPHIVRVFDIGTDSDTGEVYLVMELLEGEDVETLLTRLGPLPPLVALRIIADASLGLGAAHARGVVHRDIKPGNLFLARSESGKMIVKVLDFGVAKIRRIGPEENKSGLTVSKIPVTATGQLLGTPHYMSPEHVEGAKHVDARSDIFSLGVTLYTLLTGAPPNADCSVFVELLQRVTQGKTRPVREIAPWVPENAVAIVDKATRISKVERFSDMQAMRQAIDAILPATFTLQDDVLVAADRTPIVSDESPSEKEISVRETVHTDQKPTSKSRLVIGFVCIFAIMTLVVIVFFWK